MQRPARPFFTALAVERARHVERVGIGLKYRAEVRPLPVELLDAREVMSRQAFRCEPACLHRLLQVGNGDLIKFGRGNVETRGRPLPRGEFCSDQDGRASQQPLAYELTTIHDLASLEKLTSLTTRRQGVKADDD